jgi:type I restriction enzyme S subunit
MTRGITPYPAMRHSGVPWLGTVPTHWERRRLKSLLRPIDRRSSTGTETLLSLRRDHGIVVYSDHFSRPAQGASTVGYKLVNKGQLVVNRLQANNGLVFDSSLDGLVSPDYSVFEPREDTVMPYLSLLLRTATYRDHFRRESTGLGTGSAGFLRLYDDRFLETPVVLPPIREQTSILRFLNHADRRIRNYIRVKLKLVKLLEEQKQAIIQGAVTRGHDPHVRVKPAGVPWLPDVPEHWDVLSLRRVITQAVDGPHHSPNYVDSGIPFLSARNIKADRWSLEDAKYISEDDYAEFSRRIVPEMGDVLYTKGGTTGVARAVDLSFRFQVWVHVAVLKVKKNKALPSYLALALNSPRCYEQAQLFTRGATNQDLGLGRMKGIVFALPPLSEQEAILRAVDDQTRDLIEAIQRARHEMDLLREYRIRLFADVVTGKLDVREAAAHLPEDVEEADEGGEVDTEADVDESSDEVDAVAAEAEA